MEKVALKIISKSIIKKVSHITRLKREVRLMRLVHHPHIVKLYDVAETEKEIILAMEFVEGGELFDYIVAHKKVNENVARRVFRQILSAVDYCHRSCIIHRDLKPENLLLDNNRGIKIIDFGFANLFDPSNMMQTFCGSPYYASPEMILGRQYIGPEVDVWSLGVILFALLTGKLPFRESNTAELYKRITRGVYECPDHMSPESQDLIKIMLVVDPVHRASVDEIRNHPWTTEGYPGPPDSLLPPRPVFHDAEELDQKIIQKMTSFGLEQDAAINQILTAPTGPAFALYYLLREQQARERGHLRTAPTDQRDSQIDLENAQLHNDGYSPSQRPKAGPTEVAPIEAPRISITAGSNTSVDTTSVSSNEEIMNKLRKNASTRVARPATGRRSTVSGTFSGHSDDGLSPETMRRRRTPSQHSHRGEPRLSDSSDPIPLQAKRSRAPASESVTSSIDSIVHEPSHLHSQDQKDSTSSLSQESSSNNNIAAKTSPADEKSLAVPVLSKLFRRLSLPSGPASKTKKSTPELFNAHVSPHRTSTTAHRLGSQKLASQSVNMGSMTLSSNASMSPPSPIKERIDASAVSLAPPGLIPPEESKLRRRKSLTETISSAIKRIRSTSFSKQGKSTMGSTALGGTRDEPRASKAIFGADTTSTQSPELIVREVQRVLNENSIPNTWNGYKAQCTYQSIKFEIEVVRIYRTALRGVEMKRTKGSTWAYQGVCRTIISQLKL
ncbi:kinase-like domain-containing protein [Polychytrium aggregatum]|uniref:kinase-like domain-containing protein n=1 Tax=Polychytrium aggregatum TaxID=110093 RepID=UPI0022FE6498|nr:kinase-like domain-containing protein [Polychytrium aggregatum]KAI9205847.1 kinase-like domain-containing protein [Polychytrium aggregatum]